MASEAPEVEGYQLLRQIGAGGMGTVHEAVDGEGRHVALKLLHPHIGADPDARRRLEREVQLLNRVRDAGVARVMDADVDAVRPFVVTELVHGPTLEQDVAAGGPFAPDELLTLAHGLADALEAIHAVGVVHRDLKPGNVMLSDHGPVLIDFGIAQVADDARLTQTGMVTGTPGYLAPEVIDGGEPEPDGDWWAWAAVLVFAATGRPPFGRGPYPAVLARVSTGQVDTAGLEPRLARALQAALAPDRARRLDRDGVLAVLGGEEAPEPTTVLDGDRPDGGSDGGAGDGTASGRDDGFDAGPDADRTRALPAVGHAPDHGTHRPPAGGPVAQLPGAVGEQPTRALPQHQPARWDEAAGPVPGSGAPGGSGWPPPGPEHPVPGSAWPDPGVPPLPPWAVRPRRRTLLVGAAGLALTTLAVPRPGAFVVLGLALLLVTGTVGWAGRARRASRMRRGPRRGDDARMYAGLPWHVLRAVLSVLPGLLVGALVGAAVLLAGDRALAEPGLLPTAVDAAVVRWSAGLAALGVAWLAPTSLPSREGARATIGVLAPSRTGRTVLGVLLALLAAVGLLLAVGGDPAAVWSPLPEPPWLPGLLPWVGTA